MFTGIIEGIGVIKSVLGQSSGKRISIHSDFSLADSKIGASISVNGACLTVVSRKAHDFAADVSPETLSITNLNSIKIGDTVNLERALCLSDRLDGHLVSGHVDCTGTILQKRQMGNAIKIEIAIPEGVSKYMISKGSVAIDGISLTINHCGTSHFDVAIIPHTAQKTTLVEKNVGAVVNIETDVIGKYLERLMHHSTAKKENGNSKSNGINMEFLAKAGFI